jgi:hypothetical protein
MGWFDDIDTGGFQAGPGQRLNVQAGGLPTGVVTGDKTGGYYQGPTPQFDARLSGGAQTQGGSVDDPRWTNGTWGTGGQPQQGSQQQGGAQQQGGGQEPFNEDAFWSILESFPPTNEGQRAAQAEIQRRFGSNAPQLLDHPHRLDKWRFADGRTYDTVVGAGGANPSHGRMLEGPGHGGGGAAGGAIGAAGAMGGMDPSYGFRFAEGQKALERSAASKGTLLTGGTLKALASYGQNMASTEFGNIFNRNYQLAGLGLNAAQTGAQAGSSYGSQAGALGSNYSANQGNLITGQGNANAAGQIGASNAWGETINNVAGGVMSMPWFNRGGNERRDGTV